MKQFLFGMVALGALAQLAPSARPCSYLTNEFHTYDPAEVDRDTDPPKPPGNVRVASIKRGVGPDITGVTTSCDDMGTLAIGFVPASDLGTPADKMGYELTLVEGSLPAGMTLPGEPVRQLPSASRLLFVWVDGATDEQEPIDFGLEMVEDFAHPGVDPLCH